MKESVPKFEELNNLNKSIFEFKSILGFFFNTYQQILLWKYYSLIYKKPLLFDN